MEGNWLPTDSLRWNQQQLVLSSENKCPNVGYLTLTEQVTMRTLRAV